MAHGLPSRPRLLLATLLFVAVHFGLAASRAGAAARDLDPTFGSGGIVTTALRIDAIAIQSDGRIVVVGVDADGQGAVARHNRDGSLDTTFGVGGISLTQLGDGRAFVTVDEQQRIVVGAGTGVARFTPDGILDLTFGSSGRITTPSVQALAMRPDGTIVVVGGRRVAYHDAAGLLVSEFGLDLSDIVICPPGRPPCIPVPITGYTTVPTGIILGAGGSPFLLVAFDASGTFLGPAPVAPSVAFGRANAVDAQPDGRLVAAGVDVIRLPTGTTNGFMVVRYLGSSLDSTFSGGSVLTAIPDCPPQECSVGGADALGFQQDGRIVVAGLSNGNVTVIRYLTDGTLDATFGEDGIVVTDLGIVFDRVSDLEIQSDENILIAAGNILARYVAGIEDPRLYYLSGGSVQELAWRNGWEATNVRSEAQAPLAAGTSLAAVASGTAMESRVYYLDAAGNVQELGRVGGTATPRWETRSVGLEAHAPPAAPGSALAAIGYGPSLEPRVYYLDGFGMVQELAWFSDDGGVTPAHWHVRSIGAEAQMPRAAEGSALAALAYGPQSEPRVYYIDESGAVQELGWFSPDGGVSAPYWHLRTINEEAHKPPAALDSTLTVTQPSDTPRVYYVTGVGDVKELAWRPGPNLWYGEVAGDAATNSAIAPFGETVYSVRPDGVVEQARIRRGSFFRPLTSGIDPLSFAIPAERADAVHGSGMVWLADSLYYISAPSGIVTRLRPDSDVIPFGTVVAPADLGSPLVGFLVSAP